MTEKSNIDIKENVIVNLDSKLLDILLKDQTTKKNIIWATDNYNKLGKEYGKKKQILSELITGENGELIKPRSRKSKEEQKLRTREKAEVFTPNWVCKKQNNLVDDALFFNGFSKQFNLAEEIEFQNKSNVDKTNKELPDLINITSEKFTWKNYVNQTRLEITCGEAPYIVSRYDSANGESIPLKKRTGFLDRKLRVVNENCEEKKEWLEWAKIAFQNSYGYEWQGDNLLLARENLLRSFIDYYEDKFSKSPDIELLLEFAEIISWNIFQMDGLKFVVPMSCHKEIKTTEALPILKMLGEDKDKTYEVECEGCQLSDPNKHNGKYVKVMDWEKNKATKFTSLMFNLV